MALICQKCGLSIDGRECKCYDLDPQPGTGRVIDMQAVAVEPEEASEPLLEPEGMSPAVLAYLAKLVDQEAARTGILRRPVSLPDIANGALPTRHLCVGCGEYLATLVSMDETGPWVALCKTCFQNLKEAASRPMVTPPPAYLPAPAAGSGPLSDATLRELARQPAPASAPPAAPEPEDVLSDPEILQLAKDAGIDARTLRKLATMSAEEIEQALSNGGR